MLRLDSGSAQRSDTHAEQPDAPVERDAFQAFACGAADRARVMGRRIESAVARDGFEIIESQFEPYCLAHVTFSLKIVGQLHAKAGEYARELLAVAHRIQIVLERRFAADRLGLAVSNHRPLIAPVRGLVHPRAVAIAEVLDQQQPVGIRKLAYGPDAERLKPRTRLGADAV